jgi:hypothetical protein
MMVVRLDQLQAEISRKAGGLFLGAVILLVGLFLLVTPYRSPGTGPNLLEQTGEVFAIGLTAILLILSLVLSTMGMSGLGWLSGIFSPPPTGANSLYFDLAQAAEWQTPADFSQSFRAITREELFSGMLQTITRQRESLARQAHAIQRGRFFLLLALLPWLVALAFRLLYIFP